MKIAVITLSIIITLCNCNGQDTDQTIQSMLSCKKKITSNLKVYGIPIPQNYIFETDSVKELVLVADTSNINNPLGLKWVIKSEVLEDVIEEDLMMMNDDHQYEVVHKSMYNELYLIHYISYNTSDTIEGYRYYLSAENNIIIREIIGNYPIEIGSKSYCLLISCLFDELNIE